jgi:hypothetical protein
MISLAFMFAAIAGLFLLAAKTIQFNTAVVTNGVTYQSAQTASAPSSVETEVSVPAAKTGILAVRTNATDGTLTMDTGHGFTTAAHISIFWDGGSRYDVVLGTVSGASCPFSGGDGDDLPDALSAITAMIGTSEVCVLVGNNCAGISAYGILQPGDGDAIIEYLSSGPAVLLPYTISGGDPTGFWNGTGTNPLAGDTVATVRFSHGQVAARTMGQVSLYT